MAKKPKRDDSPHCERCGSDVVTTRGPGRVVTLGCATVRVPPELELRRCHGCGATYATPEQLQELRESADRDWLGDGGRSSRPVTRGT